MYLMQNQSMFNYKLQIKILNTGLHLKRGVMDATVDDVF